MCRVRRLVGPDQFVVPVRVILRPLVGARPRISCTVFSTVFTGIYTNRVRRNGLSLKTLYGTRTETNQVRKKQVENSILLSCCRLLTHICTVTYCRKTRTGKRVIKIATNIQRTDSAITCGKKQMFLRRFAYIDFFFPNPRYGTCFLTYGGVRDIYGSPRSPVRAGTVMRTRRSRVRSYVYLLIQGQYGTHHAPPRPRLARARLRLALARAPAVLMPPHVPFWCICTGGYRSVECTRNRNVWSEASDTIQYSTRHS